MDRNWMTLGWVTLLVRGVVGVAFGLLAMAWPDETVVVLVVLWGCWAVLDGVMAIALAGAVQGTAAKAVTILIGLVSLVAAFFALVRPGMAATALTWVIGIWLVARGISELVRAVGATAATGRWALVLSGVLDGVIGVLFLANPGQASLAIAFVVGLCAFVWGLIFIFLAFLVRRNTDQLTSAATPDAAGLRSD